MRKSVMTSVVLHVVAGVIAILWLLWCFVPSGNLFRGLATLLVICSACWVVWTESRRRGGITASAELPLMETRDPVVLVCGDQTEALFQGQRLRKTAQGWWLRVDEINQLTDTVRHIQQQQPHLAGQLSLMYLCRPDLHVDESEMRASLKSFREQTGKVVSLVGFSLPVLLSCEFSGPQTPWVMIRGDKPVVCPENESPVALEDWQQTKENILLLPLLNQAFTCIRATVIEALEKPDRLSPPVKLFAVALRTGAAPSETNSVWSHWLYRRSCLRFAVLADNTRPVSRFPDAILPLLSPFARPVQDSQRSRQLILLLLFCALAALGFSAVNNQRLIHHIGADLQRWNTIPINHYVPKIQALASLKQDALLLERWQRQGQPHRYGLGYYPGQRLWLAVQQAIDTYVPPAAPVQTAEPEPVPGIVRLDSMSLFDSGKAELKPGSTRMLVNSLVGIRAKPGWLIVISGHTDNTGSQQLNQTLSLERAVAVRNWMRDTGDVPQSCFAVQGYGDSRPVASNDTPEGRAQNRRVEISLVPHADACRLPDITPQSPQGQKLTSVLKEGALRRERNRA